MKIKDARIQLHEWIEKADSKLIRILYSTSKIYLSEKDVDTSEPQEGQLYRMIYTSARQESCGPEDIEEILNKSRKNNPELDLTGMLIYTEDRFLQVLEGPLGNIMTLYNKINQDKRHAGSRIRYCEPSEDRFFGNWHMAGKDVSKSTLNTHTEFNDNEKLLVKNMMDGDLTSYSNESMKLLKTFLSIA